MLERNRAGLNDVRDFLRHKSMAMTLRYAQLGAASNVGTRTATSSGDSR